MWTVNLCIQNVKSLTTVAFATDICKDRKHQSGESEIYIQGTRKELINKDAIWFQPMCLVLANQFVHKRN